MGGKGNRGRNRIKAPLVRLDHCHRNLEAKLEELLEHSAAISTGADTSEAPWDAVAEILAYLQRSVVRHELDEEESVFPRLASHPALRPLIERLRGDHLSQGKLVRSLETLLQTRNKKNSQSKLATLVASLRHSYLDHLRREDRELLPAIARHISKEQQDEMALEMAQRRG